MQMEIEETHPEDAARLFHLLGATLKEQHNAQQKGDFTMSAPKLNVRFKALLPCEPHFSTNSASWDPALTRLIGSRLMMLLSRSTSSPSSSGTLISKDLEDSPRGRPPSILRQPRKRSGTTIIKRAQVKKHERAGLHDQEDLNDLICYCLLWCVGPRGGAERKSSTWTKTMRGSRSRAIHT